MQNSHNLLFRQFWREPSVLVVMASNIFCIMFEIKNRTATYTIDQLERQGKQMLQYSKHYLIGFQFVFLNRRLYHYLVISSTSYIDTALWKCKHLKNMYIWFKMCHKMCFTFFLEWQNFKSNDELLEGWVRVIASKFKFKMCRQQQSMGVDMWCFLDEFCLWIIYRYFD